MIKYACGVCGCPYDDQIDDPDVEIMEGKIFQNAQPSSDWVCPDCGASGEAVMVSGHLDQEVQEAEE